MTPMDRKLDELFAAYRDSFVEADGTANFMPRLWERIEARRSFSWRLWRMSRVGVAAAAALCLAFAAFVAIPTHSTDPAGSYVDMLAADSHSDDTTLAVLGVRFDPPDSTPDAGH